MPVFCCKSSEGVFNFLQIGGKILFVPKIMIKRVILSLGLMGKFLSDGFAQEPQSSSTPILGSYKFDVPVGTSIWTCGLVTGKVFQGKSSSMIPGTNSLLTVDAADWGNFELHYVEILSGTQVGLILDIISNTARSLTLKGDIATFGLTGDESFCVRRHCTLGTIFRGGAGLIAGSDTVTLFREAGSITYSFNGTIWEDPDLEDASNVIIYPGQSFLITHNGSSPTTLTFGGGAVSFIKTGPTIVPLYAGVPNLVGLINPLVSTRPTDSFFATSATALGDFGFEESIIAGNDSVEIRQNNGTLTSEGVFVSNGSNLEDDDLNDATNKSVRNGVGVIVSVSADGMWTAPTPAMLGQ